MLIHCMDQIQAAQERIPSHLGSAQNVAPTIDFSLAETKELLQATLVIPPDPAMNWGEQTIELCNRCRLMHHGPPARTATTMQGFLCKCDLDHTLDASSGEYAVCEWLRQTRQSICSSLKLWLWPSALPCWRAPSPPISSGSTSTSCPLFSCRAASTSLYISARVSQSQPRGRLLSCCDDRSKA